MPMNEAGQPPLGDVAKTPRLRWPRVRVTLVASGRRRGESGHAVGDNCYCRIRRFGSAIAERTDAKPPYRRSPVGTACPLPGAGSTRWVTAMGAERSIAPTTTRRQRSPAGSVHRRCRPARHPGPGDRPGSRAPRPGSHCRTMIPTTVVIGIIAFATHACRSPDAGADPWPWLSGHNPGAAPPALCCASSGPEARY